MRVRPRTGLDDTSPEAHRIHVELLRQAGPQRRLQLGRSMSAFAIGQTWRAIRQAHPGASEAEVKLRFVELTYGRELATRLRDHLARRAE